MSLNPVLPPPRQPLLYGWKRDPNYKGAKGGKWVGDGEHAGQARYQQNEPGTGRQKKEPAGKGKKKPAPATEGHDDHDLAHLLHQVLHGEGEQADELFAKLQDRIAAMSPQERKEVAARLEKVLKGGKSKVAKRAASQAEEKPEPQRQGPTEQGTWKAFQETFPALFGKGNVKIPELYDEVAARVPGLTPEQFHRMLLRWRDDDLITLQVAGHRDAEKRSAEGIEGPKGLYFYVQINGPIDTLKPPIRPGERPTPAKKATPQPTSVSVDKATAALRGIYDNVFAIADLTHEDAEWAVDQALAGLDVAGLKATAKAFGIPGVKSGKDARTRILKRITDRIGSRERGDAISRTAGQEKEPTPGTPEHEPPRLRFTESESEPNEGEVRRARAEASFVVNGEAFDFAAARTRTGTWRVTFARKQAGGKQTLKQAPMPQKTDAIVVIKNVGQLTQQFIAEHAPEKFEFDADGNEPSRVRLYDMLARRLEAGGLYHLERVEKTVQTNEGAKPRTFVWYRFTRRPGAARPPAPARPPSTSGS